MDMEFHYYITFILCRHAGFGPDESYRIAYSSQYTDDNCYHYYVNFIDSPNYSNETSQTVDITKPSIKRLMIYPIFHFIPGCEDTRKACLFDCGHTLPLMTVPNSTLSRELLREAFETRNLYRIGIALHVFADTWSHQNFFGRRDVWNARTAPIALPHICHANFTRDPDRINHEWTDDRLPDPFCRINNNERFLSAAKEMFTYLYPFLHPGSTESEALAVFSQLKGKLEGCMIARAPLGGAGDARVAAYKEICPDLSEERYDYDLNRWRHAAIEKKEMELDIFDCYWGKQSFFDSDWYKFQEAVKDHRRCAMERIKPIYHALGLDSMQ